MPVSYLLFRPAPPPWPPTLLALTPARAPCPSPPAPSPLPAVPFSDILSAEALPPVSGMWGLPGTRLERLVVWTFRRSPRNPSYWFPRRVGGVCGWWVCVAVGA